MSHYTRDGRQHVDMASPADPLDELDDLRTFVTISRTHRNDIKQRQVIVRLDGGDRMTLMFGDSVTVEVPAGEHKLRAHNTLVWKTVKFVVEPGEHLEFLVINRCPAWAFAILSLLGAGPLFLKIERRSLN
jgi:hypothetical protein